MIPSYGSRMTVLKVKYALWAKDWERCVAFYKDMFDGEVTLYMEVWSEVQVRLPSPPP